MLAIGTVIAALFLSLLVTRIATIALSITGLSRESARFQARSAFTGVGFTTGEAEQVVNHPVRRRIVLLLMLLGNAGLVTILASLLISFSGAQESSQAWERVGLLLGGLIALFLLAKSRYVDKVMSRAIVAALERFTDLDVRDYADLLQLTGGYGVIELEVQGDHWVALKTLQELDLRSEGVAVLGLQHPDRSFVGVPKGDTRVAVGDTMVLYGHKDDLNRLAMRKEGPQGDREHRVATTEHQRSEPETVTGDQ